MSAAQWFYVDHSGLQQGPVVPAFFPDALRRGALQMETLVWRDGLSEWVPLHRAAGELGMAIAPTNLGNFTTTPTPQQPFTGPNALQSAPVTITDHGMILLGIPVVATLLIWFWVGGMSLLQSPGSTMTLIMLGTVFGTASVAAMEASKNGMNSVSAQGTHGPTGWFFLFILLWIVSYPMYLYKRKYYGLKNLLAAGLTAALIFAISYSIMSAAIDSKISEFQSNSGQ
jgi:hypothetical protein